jgi:hypothetical protein
MWAPAPHVRAAAGGNEGRPYAAIPDIVLLLIPIVIFGVRRRIVLFFQTKFPGTADSIVLYNTPC